MAMIDPERERRRLAELYAGRLDGELEKIASEGYQLSDPAREALRAELANRGLEIEIEIEIEIECEWIEEGFPFPSSRWRLRVKALPLERDEEDTVREVGVVGTGAKPKD
jgi:hypothetical protein